MAETVLKLRSDQFASFQVTAPTAGYTAGQMVKVEDSVGVIVETTAKTLKAVLIYSCEKIVVPKVAATGVTFAAGDKVYFKSASGAVTSVASSNTLCGRALEAAAWNATTVLIDLKGNIVA